MYRYPSECQSSHQRDYKTYKLYILQKTETDTYKRHQRSAIYNYQPVSPKIHQNTKRTALRGSPPTDALATPYH